MTTCTENTKVFTKNNNGVVAFVLALACVLCLAGFSGIASPTTAYAATTGTSNGFEYSVSSGVATITKYKGTSKAVTVPSKVDGYPVMYIADCAFDGNTKITSVSFPDTTKGIGAYAFRGCTSLTTVTLPKNLTSVGYHAFENTTALTSIKLNSADVSSWGSCVFKNAGTKSSGITVTCGSSCTRIPSGFMFDSGAKVVKVTLSSSVNAVSLNAFRGCADLKSVTFTDSLQEIGNSAFYGCSSLTSITLPKNLKWLGSGAFSDTTSLKNIYLNSTDISNCSQMVFKNAGLGSSGITLTCGSTCKRIPDYFMANFYSNTIPNVTKVVVSSSVTTIGQSAFLNCTHLNAVTIGLNVKTIEGYAFKGCSSLKNVTLPMSVTKVSANAFVDLSKGSTVVVPTKALYNTFTNGSYCITPSNTKVIYRPTHLSEGSIAAISNKAYTGKSVKPGITLKLNGTTLKAGTDYTLTYKNNTKTGKATVTATGKGKYSGSISKSFNIKPAKVTSVKAKSKSKGKVTVSWPNSKGKAAGVSGYKIVMKLGSKTIKTQYVSGSSAKSKTVSVAGKYKGKKVKTYVYAYKNIGNSKVCSTASSASTVKVKK